MVMRLLLSQIVLLVIAIWKIRWVLKYKKSSQLFLNEIGGNWIDKTKTKTAIKFYVPLEISFFVMVAATPALFYFTATRPFFWPTIITLLIVWFTCCFWWLAQFKVKKNDLSKHL